jgi:uncharacterized phage protein (TIGR01671 family)
MREIEFRAWDTYQKKMYSWREIGKHDSENNFSLWNLLNNLINDGKNRIIPMQYTGLKDKNGVKVFEGDIVKHDNFSNGAVLSFSGEDVQPKALDVVELDNFFQPVKLKGFGMRFYKNEISEKLEVIGNIHMNPELLK